MPNVRNYTIGDPSQPGKMVVLNGNLDVYDANGKQTVTNGILTGGSTLFRKQYGEVTSQVFPSSTNVIMGQDTVTIPDRGYRPNYFKVTLLVPWCSYGSVSAGNAVEALVMIDNADASSGGRAMCSQNIVKATGTTKGVFNATNVQDITPGDHIFFSILTGTAGDTVSTFAGDGMAPATLIIEYA